MLPHQPVPAAGAVVAVQDRGDVVDVVGADMLNAPMSEESLRFERALAKAQNRYVDDPLALASFLERRKLSVGNSRRTTRQLRDQRDDARGRLHPAGVHPAPRLGGHGVSPTAASTASPPPPPDPTPWNAG